MVIFHSYVNLPEGRSSHDVPLAHLLVVQVIASDFARLQAETQAAEEAAKAEYEEFMEDSKVPMMGSHGPYWMPTNYLKCQGDPWRLEEFQTLEIGRAVDFEDFKGWVLMRHSKQGSRFFLCFYSVAQG